VKTVVGVRPAAISCGEEVTATSGAVTYQPASSACAGVESWTATKMPVDDERMCGRRSRLSPEEIRLLDASGFTAEVSDERGGKPRAQDLQGAALNEAEVPGLSRLLESLPMDWHPDSIMGLLRTPHTDLAIDGHPATPLDGWHTAEVTLTRFSRLSRLQNGLRGSGGSAHTVADSTARSRGLSATVLATPSSLACFTARLDLGRLRPAMTPGLASQPRGRVCRRVVQEAISQTPDGCQYGMCRLSRNTPKNTSSSSSLLMMSNTCC
jgi:hypothetical protein